MLKKIFQNTFSRRDAMSQLSWEERVLVVEKYFERKSYIAVQAEFQQRYIHAPPYKRTIQQNIKKYRSYGMSLNRNKENSGWRRTIRSEENIERVKIMLENVPRTLLQEEMAWDYLLQHLTQQPVENCVNTHTW